ncbi:MAG: hypothetical protein GXP27_09065, partial [Planctomycetes bacterium]|nr:hypothetical protein [Planctomycetota bacterium]
MGTRVCGIAALFALAGAVGLASAAERTVAGKTRPSFRVGFAERDITPKIGMERPGGYGKVFHRKLHDPCKVRAAVFDDGKTQVALVGVDALVVPDPLVKAVREGIQQRCGIAPAAVLIG